MIHFEGERSFPLPVAEVAAQLSDAAFLVGCPSCPSSRVGRRVSRSGRSQTSPYATSSFVDIAG